MNKTKINNQERDASYSRYTKKISQALKKLEKIAEKDLPLLLR
ncbi:MAG: hypothetical protein AAB373_01190 [Patescibacteria group bacterium]